MEDENPLHEFVKALARRRARLDAVAGMISSAIHEFRKDPSAANQVRVIDEMSIMLSSLRSLGEPVREEANDSTPVKGRRKRIPRAMMMRAAELSSEYGVRVLLKPDGTMVIEGVGQPAPQNHSPQFSEPAPSESKVPPPLDLDHRETRLFDLLGHAGVGVPVSVLGVRNCGAATCQKLIKRGLAKATDDSTEIALTKKGLRIWQAMQSDGKNHQYL